MSQNQPDHGSQSNYPGPRNHGAPQQNRPGPQDYPGPRQNHLPYGTQQPYGYGGPPQSYGYGVQQSYGYGGAPQCAMNPVLLNSQSLPVSAYGAGSAQFWNANESERTTALWTHLGAVFTGFLPLIMFLVKKDESPFIREHSRQGLNAMITNVIVTFAASFVLGIVGFVLAFVTMGLGILIIYIAFIVPLVYAVLYIMAAVAANKGEGYRIPLTINFVK